MEAGGAGVAVPRHIAGEAVDGLALAPAGLEGGRIETEGVMRAARVLGVGPVQEGTGPAPAAIQEALVETGALRRCRCEIRKPKRGRSKGQLGKRPPSS